MCVGCFCVWTERCVHFAFATSRLWGLIKMIIMSHVGQRPSSAESRCFWNDCASILVLLHVSEFSTCWWTLSALVVTEGWPGWVALGHWLKKNIALQKSWPVIHNGRWLWRVGSIYNSFDSRDDGRSQTGGRNIAHILYSRLQYIDRSIWGGSQQNQWLQLPNSVR